MLHNSEKIVLFVISSTIIALALIAFVLYVVVTSKKKHYILLRNLQISELNAQKNILNAQLEIQEETFKKISQEIHDNISLSLTLAKLNLNTINASSHELASTKIESTIDLISKSLNDLNDISKSLDAEFIENQGLLKAVQYECDIIQKSGKFLIDLEITGPTKFLDSSKELLIFRMIQEAFNNIIKHSGAGRIDIRMCYSEDLLTVEISDDGKGFAHDQLVDQIQQLPSAGLRNFINRASILQAKVNFQHNEPSGTKLVIQIPIS